MAGSDDPVLHSSITTAFPDPVEDLITIKKQKMSKKFYPKYNIAVDSLNKLSTPRATSALNFKERRLAKVHREQVASTVLSYKEKMLVKNL